MSVTNEEYQEALEIIASRDEQAIGDSIELVLDARECLKDVVDAITELRNSLPAINYATQSTARNHIENLYNQITSFNSQLVYTKQSLESLKTQYTPVSTPEAPVQ